MEDENQKARRTARREYNDAVRELVGFVRKRDKRVAKVGTVLACTAWDLVTGLGLASPELLSCLLYRFLSC